MKINFEIGEKITYLGLKGKIKILYPSNGFAQIVLNEQNHKEIIVSLEKLKKGW